MIHSRCYDDIDIAKLFPRTLKEVSEEESEQAGENPCICLHSRASHKDEMEDCAFCSCAAYASEAGIRNFNSRFGRVPAEMEDTAYVEALNREQK